MATERDTPDGSPLDADEGATETERTRRDEHEHEHEHGPAPARGSAGASRRRLRSIFVLLFGGLVAIYLATMRPQEQHVRVVLGGGAPEVSALELRYVASDGELAREARFTYAPGQAPRVVAHELELPNGDYRLDIELDARDGRRTVQRQVTLGGGSTQVDVSDALRQRSPRDEPANGDEAR